MSTAIPAANQPRQLTTEEKQRFSLDVWNKLQELIAPSGGVLDGVSYGRVIDHAAQNHLDKLKMAFLFIRSDYDRAVELQAQAWLASVRDLLHQPATPNQKGYDPLYLTWKQEPKAVTQRRSLYTENFSETQKIAPDHMLTRVEDEKKADAAAQAQKDHEKGVRAATVAIDTLMIQGRNGLPDNGKIAEHQKVLRKWMKDNLTDTNGQKIWKVVRQSIASIHQQVEREMVNWNSR